MMSGASDEFCRAINEGDIEVAKAALVRIPNFGNAIKHLVDWLLQCGCIEYVTLSNGILKSQPPQKMLTLTTRPPGAARTFHLKLSLGSHMEIHDFEG
jgi:hypothetical protein